MNAKQYDEAAPQYTAALSLGPSGPQNLPVKRTMARLNKGEWDNTLNGANEVVHFQIVQIRPC